MNTTPLAERRRVVLWGLRNAGKSSLMNGLLTQEVSIVSPVPGTTTDAVTRAMEILPAGPVALTDTAGLDDTDGLGPQRVAKAMTALLQADVALWVTPNHLPVMDIEELTAQQLISKGISLVAALTYGQNGKNPAKEAACRACGATEVLAVDNPSGVGHTALLETLGRLLSEGAHERSPLEGLVKPGALVVLVTPIDMAAPKGRLILPQVETLRDVLDRDAAALVVKEKELGLYRFILAKADLVVTDSQAFAQVAAAIPASTPLTSFSLLFARKKGDLGTLLPSLSALKQLRPGARILVWEACRHHRQADDLAMVKIPNLVRTLYQKDVSFELKRDWPTPKELQGYALVLACGGCTVTRRRMLSHIEKAKEAGVPVLNYGLFLAEANGLLPRALEPFPEWKYLRERATEPVIVRRG